MKFRAAIVDKNTCGLLIPDSKYINRLFNYLSPDRNCILGRNYLLPLLIKLIVLRFVANTSINF